MTLFWNAQISVELFRFYLYRFCLSSKINFGPILKISKLPKIICLSNLSIEASEFQNVRAEVIRLIWALLHAAVFALSHLKEGIGLGKSKLRILIGFSLLFPSFLQESSGFVIVISVSNLEEMYSTVAVSLGTSAAHRQAFHKQLWLQNPWSGWVLVFCLYFLVFLTECFCNPLHVVGS